MPGVPDSFIRRIKRLPQPFRRDDVLDAFEDDLKESSVTVYLSLLNKSGHLRRLGPKEFRWVQPEADESVDTQVRRIVPALEGRVAPDVLSRTVAWSDHALAPFLHDAPMLPFIVLEVLDKTQPTFADALQDHGRITEVSTRTRMGDVIWSHASVSSDRLDIFIVTTTDLRGTRPSREGPRIPSLERLFLDVLRFERLGLEPPTLMAIHPDFDPLEALRLAGGRGETARVASFLTWTAMRNPTIPSLAPLRNEFAHLRTEA